MSIDRIQHDTFESALYTYQNNETKHNFKTLLSIVLNHGYAIDFELKGGQTLLHHAVSLNLEYETIQIIKYGARLMRNNYGKTPIDIALERGNQKIIQLLRRSADYQKYIQAKMDDTHVCRAKSGSYDSADNTIFGVSKYAWSPLHKDMQPTLWGTSYCVGEIYEDYLDWTDSQRITHLQSLMERLREAETKFQTDLEVHSGRKDAALRNLKGMNRELRNREHRYCMKIWETVEEERESRKDLERISQSSLSIKKAIENACQRVLYTGDGQMRYYNGFVIKVWKKVCVRITGAALHLGYVDLTSHKSRSRVIALESVGKVEVNTHLKLFPMLRGREGTGKDALERERESGRDRIYFTVHFRSGGKDDANDYSPLPSCVSHRNPPTHPIVLSFEDSVDTSSPQKLNCSSVSKSCRGRSSAHQFFDALSVALPPDSAVTGGNVFTERVKASTPPQASERQSSAPSDSRLSDWDSGLTSVESLLTYSRSSQMTISGTMTSRSSSMSGNSFLGPCGTDRDTTEDDATGGLSGSLSKGLYSALSAPTSSPIERLAGIPTTGKHFGVPYESPLGRVVEEKDGDRSASNDSSSLSAHSNNLLGGVTPCIYLDNGDGFAECSTPVQQQSSRYSTDSIFSRVDHPDYSERSASAAGDSPGSFFGGGGSCGGSSLAQRVAKAAIYAQRENVSSASGQLSQMSLSSSGAVGEDWISVCSDHDERDHDVDVVDAKEDIQGVTVTRSTDRAAPESLVSTDSSVQSCRPSLLALSLKGTTRTTVHSNSVVGDTPSSSMVTNSPPRTEVPRSVDLVSSPLTPASSEAYVCPATNYTPCATAGYGVFSMLSSPDRGTVSTSTSFSTTSPNRNLSNSKSPTSNRSSSNTSHESPSRSAPMKIVASSAVAHTSQHNMEVVPDVEMDMSSAVFIGSPAPSLLPDTFEDKPRSLPTPSTLLSVDTRAVAGCRPPRRGRGDSDAPASSIHSHRRTSSHTSSGCELLKQSVINRVSLTTPTSSETPLRSESAQTDCWLATAADTICDESDEGKRSSVCSLPTPTTLCSMSWGSEPTDILKRQHRGRTRLSCGGIACGSDENIIVDRRFESDLPSVHFLREQLNGVRQHRNDIQKKLEKSITDRENFLQILHYLQSLRAVVSNPPAAPSDTHTYTSTPLPRIEKLNRKAFSILTLLRSSRNNSEEYQHTPKSSVDGCSSSFVASLRSVGEDDIDYSTGTVELEGDIKDRVRSDSEGSANSTNSFISRCRLSSSQERHISEAEQFVYSMLSPTTLIQEDERSMSGKCDNNASVVLDVLQSEKSIDSDKNPQPSMRSFSRTSSRTCSSDIKCDARLSPEANRREDGNKVSLSISQHVGPPPAPLLKDYERARGYLEEMWHCDMVIFETVEKLAQCLLLREQTWQRLRKIQAQESIIVTPTIDELYEVDLF